MNLDGSPLIPMDMRGKVIVHLDDDELSAIAKAVVDEMYRRTGKISPDTRIPERD